MIYSFKHFLQLTTSIFLAFSLATIQPVMSLFEETYKKMTNITFFVGDGQRGFSGDGGPATTAKLNFPRNLAIHPVSGDLFISDSSNYRIRRVDNRGIKSTFAGTGDQGFSGDGGPATAAMMGMPVDFAVHPVSGDLFISERSNNRIRKIDSRGIISTFAGSGDEGFSGDGGPATDARLSQPLDLAFHPVSHDLFISDSSNYRIQRVDNRGIISTFAGTGDEGFSGDGGPATAAMLFYPTSIVLHPVSGDLFFTELNNYGTRIRKIDNRGIISTFAAFPSNVASLAVHRFSGHLFFSDRSNFLIRKVDNRGINSTVAGTGKTGFSGNEGRATDAAISYPGGLAFHPVSGDLFFSDTSNHRIRKVFDIINCSLSSLGPLWINHEQACLQCPYGYKRDGSQDNCVLSVSSPLLSLSLSSFPSEELSNCTNPSCLKGFFDESPTVVQTKADLIQAKADLVQTKASLNQTTVNLAQTKASLNQTTADLTQTKASLKQTTANLVQTMADLSDLKRFIQEKLTPSPSPTPKPSPSPTATPTTKPSTKPSAKPSKRLKLN